jgi:hypothetical protein
MSLAAALAAVVMDAARSIAASAVTLTELEPIWTALSPQSLALFREFVQLRLVPVVGAWIWSPVATWLLATPVTLELMALGFLLLVAGSRKQRRSA